MTVGGMRTPSRKAGEIPRVSIRLNLNVRLSTLTRDGTVEPVSRDQILRHERGQGIFIFPYSADHEKDWQPYSVDPYSAESADPILIHRHASQGPLFVMTLMWVPSTYFGPRLPKMTPVKTYRMVDPKQLD